MIAASVLVAVGWRAWRPTSSVLTMTVASGRMSDAGELEGATETTGFQTVFSDGTRFEWRPGARGHVRAITAHGAYVALDRGTIDARVTPKPAAAWAINAGPFLVAVKGTAFELDWSPREQRFSLALHEGSVAVRGPILGEVLLSPGQAVSVSLRDRTASYEPGPAEAPRTAPAPVVEREPAPQRNATPSPGRGWPASVAAGDFAEVVQQAERMGLERAIARASRAELAALADAARYARRSAIARQALEAQLARFPASAEGRQASFFLGRLAEDAGRDDEAVSWYDRYLMRDPNGPFVAEAYGRKLMARARAARTGDVQSVRALARDYLARFPSGSYANAASRLLEER